MSDVPLMENFPWQNRVVEDVDCICRKLLQLLVLGLTRIGQMVVPKDFMATGRIFHLENLLPVVLERKKILQKIVPIKDCKSMHF